MIGIPRVAGQAEDGIVAVRTKAQFRHIGLAHDDCTGFAHPRDIDGILFRDEVFEQQATQRAAQPLRLGKVLDGLGNAVQGADILVARQGKIGLFGLRDQFVARAHRNDCVDRRVHRFDVIEIGHHDLDGRDLLAPEHPCQRHGLKPAEFGKCVGLVHGSSAHFHFAS
jgi:hypothetical protein